MLQKVQRGDFPRPRQIKPDVVRALEAICLKAMALEPERSLCLAAALADDIEHWLADEPVGAWPEPFSVKAGLGARHKPLVSGVRGAAWSVIVVTSGAIWFESEQAEAESKQLLAEAEDAQAGIGRGANSSKSEPGPPAAPPR